jgi:hypothetical protein
MAKSKSEPSLEDKIRARAHELWVRDGRPDGQHLAHWQQAEAELRGKTSPRAARAKSSVTKPRTPDRASRGRSKTAAE